MFYLGSVFRVGGSEFRVGDDHPAPTRRTSKYTVAIFFRVGKSKFRVGDAHPAHPLDKSLLMPIGITEIFVAVVVADGTDGGSDDGYYEKNGVKMMIVIPEISQSNDKLFHWILLFETIHQ